MTTRERLQLAPTVAEAPPSASVIVPVLNEGSCIDEVLQRLREQTVSDFEVIFADGGSTDDTCRRLDAAAAADPRIRLLANPRRLQAAGLNEALRLARAEILIRLDGHSFIEPDYVERTLAVLASSGADVVGGRMVPRPGATVRASAIALANRSRWGAGPARFHGGGYAGPAETVYLGSFRRSAVVAVGGWAEDVGVNEDYELNHRIRAAGGVVWFDPSLEVGYRPRSCLRALARQYLRYGRSKAMVARRHPGSVRARQVLPALGVPAVVVAPALWWWLPFVVVAAHVALVAAAVAWTSRRSAERPIVGVVSAAAAVVMHWSWSVGFWIGVVRPFPPAGR